MIDLSRLDGIYELHLIRCQKINNISSLNHNQKIVIKLCQNIFNYSNCLRYSKSLSIEVCWSHRTINLDLSSLLEVRDIKITAYKGSPYKTNLIFPSCKSLRSIEINGFPFPFILPPHNNVRSVKIVECRAFTSLLNFEKVRFAKISSTNLKSLDGLGSEVREVEIDAYSFIKDFSKLKKCKKVRIHGWAQALHYITQLHGVEDFTFCLEPESNLTENLKGLTCLSFIQIPENLLSIKFPSTLRRLEFRIKDYDDSSLLKILSDFIMTIPPQVNHIRLYATKKLLKEYKIISSNFSTEVVPDGVYFWRKQN